MAEEETMEGYCVRCKDKDGKKKREMKDVRVEQTKKGGYMAKGLCAECGTKMCVMMKKEDAQKLQ